MAKKPLPTPDELRQLLSYDPETGDLFWKERPISMFGSLRAARSWNSMWAGKPALAFIHIKGYKTGTLLDRGVKAHRVAFALHHGHWPDVVDHINGNPSDNRASNLRSASQSENMRNVKVRSGSSSRYLGVSWHKASGKWVAQLRAKDGKRFHLGTFSSEEDAAMAYDTAARSHHGAFARPNFPSS